MKIISKTIVSCGVYITILAVLIVWEIKAAMEGYCVMGTLLYRIFMGTLAGYTYHIIETIFSVLWYLTVMIIPLAFIYVMEKE